MKITIAGSLARRKAAAEATINARFDRMVSHADLVAIASGDIAGVMSREGGRMTLLARLAAAQSPDDIETILQELERP